MEENTWKKKHEEALEQFNRQYNTGVMTTCKVDDKLELIRLVCFLYINLHKKDPNKFPNCCAVLNTIYKRDITDPTIKVGEEKRTDHMIKFIWTIAIICDELVWGNNGVMENPGYANSQAMIERIKHLFNQFIPF